MGSGVRVGTVIAGYRIESWLGEGAMGTVYLAEEPARGRRVALKLLAPELGRDERFRRRFLRESTLAATLDHPNVVPTVEAGEQDGVLYLAMAYVDGPDLREVLQREGRLAPERAIGLVAQVGAALDVAHAAGLVHRDVKPANILLAPTPAGDRAYVCDFGLARHVSSASSLTTDRGLVGTLDYISPEQIEGGDIDGRADVYALGCVLFECIAGSLPFDRESELTVVFAHLNEPPPRISELTPGLPSAFDDVFARALAKKPKDRYSTCGELARAARAALEGKPSAPRRKLQPRLLGLAAVLALAAAVGGIVASRDGGAPNGKPAITPTSIAGARLGLRRSEYERILGQGILIHQKRQDEEGSGTGYLTLAFEAKKVWVFFPDGIDGRGEIITTWNEDYKTAAGVGPCSTITELKAAYGDRVHPDRWATIGRKRFAYQVGKNLIFSASGPPARPPIPVTYIPAVGIFDGSAPHADEDEQAHPYAVFVTATGNETPLCTP